MTPLIEKKVYVVHVSLYDHEGVKLSTQVVKVFADRKSAEEFVVDETHWALNSKTYRIALLGDTVFIFFLEKGKEAKPYHSYFIQEIGLTENIPL